MDGQQTNIALAGTMSAGQSQRSMPQTPRTFDGIADAVSRVRATSDQVSRMLDRISPTPRAVPESSAMNAASLSSPPYASSLEQLHLSLNELGTQLDQLDKHV